MVLGRSLKRRQTKNELLTVPEKVRRRASQALAMGTPKMWVEQTLYLIGHNVTHHRPNDPLLDEAIVSAQALLALLVEMRESES